MITQRHVALSSDLNGYRGLTRTQGLKLFVLLHQQWDLANITSFTLMEPKVYFQEVEGLQGAKAHLILLFWGKKGHMMYLTAIPLQNALHVSTLQVLLNTLNTWLYLLPSATLPPSQSPGLMELAIRISGMMKDYLLLLCRIHLWCDTDKACEGHELLGQCRKTYHPHENRLPLHPHSSHPLSALSRLSLINIHIHLTTYTNNCLIFKYVTQQTRH